MGAHGMLRLLLRTLAAAALGQTVLKSEVRDFEELWAQRRAQGLRLTHLDFPPYAEGECTRLIGEINNQARYAPTPLQRAPYRCAPVQVPLSCMADRVKRLFLLAQARAATRCPIRPPPFPPHEPRAQDAWAIAAEATAKLGEKAENPGPAVSSLLQQWEGIASADGAPVAGSRAEGRRESADSPEDAREGGAFLETAAGASPLAPMGVPQMAELVRRLEWVLAETAAEVSQLDPDKPSTGVPS